MLNNIFSAADFVAGKFHELLTGLKKSRKFLKSVYNASKEWFIGCFTNSNVQNFHANWDHIGPGGRYSVNTLVIPYSNNEWQRCCLKACHSVITDQPELSLISRLFCAKSSLFKSWVYVLSNWSCNLNDASQYKTCDLYS